MSSTDSPNRSRRSVRDLVSSGWTSLRSPRLPFRRSQTLAPQPQEETSTTKRLSLVPTIAPSVVWKSPSDQTRKEISDLFERLFRPKLQKMKTVCDDSGTRGNISEGYTLDVRRIETTLARCSPDEDVLELEDRDHYNLIQKAIIFNCPEAVNVLLNHGCSTSGVACGHPGSCTVSHSSRCPHGDLQALHLASFHGHVSIVKMLLIRGADRFACARVYTSAVLNDPYGLQPDVLKSLGHNSRVTDILHKCGPREPVFYAVLEDHLETLKILMGDSQNRTNGKTRSENGESGDESEEEIEKRHPPQYGHLVNLASRVGAYHCLKYLLNLFPSHVNVRDADGMPPILMALNHSTRFVRLLLDAGADVHVLDDFIEPGCNILHLLIKVLPIDGCGDHASLSPIVDSCLQQGVRVNAQRQPYNRTPLHDLLTVVNMPISAVNADNKDKPPEKRTTMYNGIDKLTHKENGHSQNYGVEQRCFDDELIRCVQLLIQYGADLNAEDSEGKTPLQILLSSGNHILRCNLCFDYRVSVTTQKTMVDRNFGMQNTISITKILLKSGASIEPNTSSATPLLTLIEMICSSYFGSDFWAWTHSLEILEELAITNSYCELVGVLLDNKCNPNLTVVGTPPPILLLLSHITRSPYTDDYIISLRSALGIQKILHVFLQHDTFTEITVLARPNPSHNSNRKNSTTTYGCLNMLAPILRTLTTFKQAHTGEDLLVLKVIMLCLFQHGASSLLHPSSTLLYGNNSELMMDSNEDILYTHTFLYQFLLFGLNNLAYVGDGSWYKECAEILYSESPHDLLQPALNLIADQLRISHPRNMNGAPCNCGQCFLFHGLIHSMLSRPRRLKQICRLAIRAAVGGRLYTSSSMLGLPPAIVHYLKTFVP